MVKLSPSQQQLIDNMRRSGKKKVLFVCLGNICRSPAADGIMRSIAESGEARDEWEIDSAGTGGWHVGDLPDKRMRVHARRRGLELDHVCRQVRESDFDDFDLIIGMDDNNVADLRRLAPSIDAARKVVPMSAFVDDDFHCDHIPDPYYSGAEGFEHVLDLLENGCRNLFEMLEGR